MAETIQNLFLVFQKTMQLIFMALQNIADFYGDYGFFFFAFLLVLYLTDTYISKTRIMINMDAKKDGVQNPSIYPKWKIGLVLLIGSDCFFNLPVIRDNLTYLILLVYTAYVLRKLLVYWKFKKRIKFITTG